jgi:3-hydroxyisobutyrate dehydrogenase-like beta-hydroxyacid dehydrogenase
MTSGELRRFALIGFGEAGAILGADLAAAGREVVTYDILLDAASTRASLLDKARAARVRTADTLAEAVAGAQVVISAVTAASSSDVAASAAEVLRADQVLLDINSVSPAKKLANAAMVEAAGAGYVEAAVMAPVPPQRLRVPMLLGGKGAAQLAGRLRGIGMNTTAISAQIGVASAVKMCRSIVIKGLEALTVECVVAARRFGAEREVLESLHGTFPNMGWTGPLPDYLVSRVAEHGTRRAAEMREVARTLRDVGLEPTMALATAVRQDWLIETMAANNVSFTQGVPFSWRELADALAANALAEQGTPTSAGSAVTSRVVPSPG